MKDLPPRERCSRGRGPKRQKNGAEIKDSMRVHKHICEQSVFVHQSARTSCKCVCECVGVWLGEVKIGDEEKCFQRE